MSGEKSVCLQGVHLTILLWSISQRRKYIHHGKRDEPSPRASDTYGMHDTKVLFILWSSL